MDLPEEAVTDGKYWELIDDDENFFGIILQRKTVREEIVMIRSEKTKAKEEAEKAERMKKIAAGKNLLERRDKEELARKLCGELGIPFIPSAFTGLEEDMKEKERDKEKEQNMEVENNNNANQSS